MDSQGSATIRTLADLLESLGGISPERVRMRPAPGTATVDDVVAADETEDRLCELIDGVLVEKARGFRESMVACTLIVLLRAHVDARKLGVVSGEAGMMRLFPDQVRIPDVAFASWARFPGRKVSQEAVPELVPDLAVEIISQGNTPREMARKIKEYLTAGVWLVWMVDLEARTVTVHAPSRPPRVRSVGETLEGGDVLPGLSFRVEDLFPTAPSPPPPSPARRSRAARRTRPADTPPARS